MTWGLGLGRSQTRLGRWMDVNGITQRWLESKTGISDTTITKLCRDTDYRPTEKTKMIIISVLRHIEDDLSVSDFW